LLDQGKLQAKIPKGQGGLSGPVLPDAVHATPAGGPDAACAGSSGLIFHEPWWLNAVTGGQFEEATVRNGDRVVGRLPYVVRRKLGFTSLRMPAFTHLLGPIVDGGTGKPQTLMLRRLSIVRELLDQLPPFHYFKQALHPGAADGLAFQDRGFQLTVQYTFRIDGRVGADRMWQDMHFKTRQHIRRADEKFSVRPVTDPHAFIHFYLKNLTIARRMNRVDLSSLPAIFEETKRRGCGTALAACWPDGTPTAMIYVVWDRSTMYYLLSTRAHDRGDNGSVNLLIWSAMQLAGRLGLELDLDGVSTSGTARFLSGFGGRLDLRLIAQRSHLLYAALRSAKRRILRREDETESFT
jgi:hypothetical protein